MSTEYELNQTPLEDWIDEGVSFLQANVTLYRNPSIYAQYQPVLEQIRSLEAELAPKKARVKKETSLGDEESLGADAPQGEESLGDDDLTIAMNARLEELYTEAERLWKLYSDDVEIWTLRRLDQSEVSEVQKGMDLAIPEQPNKPGSKPSKQMQAAYVKKFETFLVGMKEYADELNLRCLALSVMKVVVKGEEKPAPSLEGLRRLKARPGGQGHVYELVEAMENLAQEGVDIMAPHRSGAGA
jgi:hypothetical protein